MTKPLCASRHRDDGTWLGGSAPSARFLANVAGSARSVEWGGVEELEKRIRALARRQQEASEERWAFAALCLLDWLLSESA